MLVTLEGLDGCGKSTAVESLRTHFPDAVFTCEPTDSWYGAAVARSVADGNADPLAELFLYCADHADHLDRTIKPALDHDKLVISDRYVDSRIAYQSVTLSDRLDDAFAYVRDLHEPISITPDLTCYLDVSVETALERSGESTKFERRPILETVTERYHRLIDAEPGRFVVIDAERDASAVVSDIAAAIDQERTA